MSIVFGAGAGALAYRFGSLTLFGGGGKRQRDAGGDAPYSGDFEVELRCTEGNHNKWYNIKLSGRTVKTRHGPVGGELASPPAKTFATPDEALREALKIFKAKTNRSKEPYVYYCGDPPAGMHAAAAGAGAGGACSAPPGRAAADDARADDIAVMLAHPYDGDFDKVRGWIASQKYDGVRAVFRRGKMYTRNGKRLHPPPEFVAALPPDATLDGELWVDYGKFDLANSLVSAHEMNPLWKQAKYIVFDTMDDPTRPLEARLAALRAAGVPNVVESERVHSQNDIDRMHERVKALGGEARARARMRPHTFSERVSAEPGRRPRTGADAARPDVRVRVRHAIEEDAQSERVSRHGGVCSRL